MVNASNEGICIEFWWKNNTTLVHLLSKTFMTNPLNIIFDEFSIWLLGYRTEFSCLYLPQGHSLISTVWLWSTDEYVFLWLRAKGHINCWYIPWTASTRRARSKSAATSCYNIKQFGPLQVFYYQYIVQVCFVEEESFESSLYVRITENK
mgnify:CR=1 FL=1